MTLGEYLKQNGISLTAFSASIGENIPTVHGWISGRRRPLIPSLVEIERVTGGAVRAIDFVQPSRSPSSKVAPSANDAPDSAEPTSSAAAA